MLLVAQLNEKQLKKLPQNYYQLNLKERLYIQRSAIPAVTHIDFSARVQTVHKETNPRYWGLINNFKKLSGCGVIVNTSFNVRGEPIVCTPEDAYKCFMRTEMDYLVIGNYLFNKNDQPEWKNDEKWKTDLVMD
jgi:carbamoyltransferase